MMKHKASLIRNFVVSAIITIPVLFLGQRQAMRAQTSLAAFATETPVAFPITSDYVFLYASEVSVLAKESEDFPFTLEHDASVSIVVMPIGDPGCNLELLDGTRFYELKHLLSYRTVVKDMYGGERHLLAVEQYPLQKGEHIITFNINTWADSECHSLVYIYEVSAPHTEDINQVAVGITSRYSIAAGGVNIHTFNMPREYQYINICVIPDTDTKMQPVIRLHNPDGTLFATALYDSAIHGTCLLNLRLVSDDRYAIIVQDWNHADAGEYEITVTGAPPLVINVGDVRLATLPYYGPHLWIVNVEPSDLIEGRVECIAYSLVSNQPKPYIVGAVRSGNDFQSRTSDSNSGGFHEPGTYEVSVVNISREGSGKYVCSCVDVGQHRPLGIGGTFKFEGDYFTRFIPAIKGLSASFSLQTATDRDMQLELWYGTELIAQATGESPSFEVVFPEDAVYTLRSRGAQGTGPEITKQWVSMQWVYSTPPSSGEAESIPTAEVTLTVEAVPTTQPTSKPTLTTEPEPHPQVKQPIVGTAPLLLVVVFCTCMVSTLATGLTLLLALRRKP